MIYISELSYSLHLGSDKNRKNISKQKAKTNVSGTTSLSNNAIQNARALSRVDKHNYRKYDDNEHLIEIIRGTKSLYNDVVNLYTSEFEQSRIEYNNKQTREDRKINNYFKKISDNSKNDLACEIIIELGDKTYWDTKDDNFKHKMTNVFKEQVNDLELLVPNFKVASAIIHYDETSPHLHIVGVPIKYKNKNGMEKQVGKSDVFTKTELIKLQDKMRTLCIEEYNKVYGLNDILKAKQKGRNKDINVKDMTNYIEFKEELEQNKKNLEIINNKNKELDNMTNNIKKTIDELKKTPIIKDKYIFSESNKQDFINFIEQVDKNNQDVKKIQKLSLTLNNLDNELKENKEKIKVLTENNKALSLKVETLSNNIDKKNKEIKELKKENSNLKNMVDYFKALFNKLIKFFNKKMFSDKNDRNNYYSVSKDLYEHGIFDDDTMYEIKDNYDYNKDRERISKDRDDFER